MKPYSIKELMVGTVLYFFQVILFQGFILTISNLLRRVKINNA